MALADQIVVLDRGAFQQIGPPNEIYHKPANTMVAQFMGSPAMNMVNGAYDEGMPGRISIKIANGESYLWRRKEAQVIEPGYSGNVLIGFRPEDASFRIAQSPLPDSTTIANNEDEIPADIYVSEPVGTHTILTVKVGEKLVKAFAPPDLNPEIGTKGGIVVREGRLHIFSTNEGKRIV